MTYKQPAINNAFDFWGTAAMATQHNNEPDGGETVPVGQIKRNLNTRGCPACDFLDRKIFDMFSSLQYRLCTVPSESQLLGATLGFCARHTWQLAAVASPRGAALAWTPLLVKLKDALSAMASAADPGAAMGALVHNRATCRICRQQLGWERNYVAAFAVFVGSPDGRAVYGASQGVCLPHLALLLPCLPAPDDRQFVLEHAARFFARLTDDLAGFDTKYDALRRDQLSADERDAYWRMIIHLAGSRRGCSP